MFVIEPLRIPHPAPVSGAVKGFNHKHSRSYQELYVYWIDTDLKTETKEAMKNGVTFEPEINTYDQFKTP